MKDAATKIAAMTEGGEKLAGILQELLDYSVPGRTLAEVERLALKRIAQEGGEPSFTSVEDYGYATCLCVDDVIVHGIPTEQKLKEGNIFTIDVGMVYKGFHTDTAWTKVIRNTGSSYTVPPDVEEFLATGKKALADAIKEARPGNRIGHISRAISEVVGGKGYGIAKSLIGHGVGEELHMPPQIPGYLKGKIEHTPQITAGMSIAVEVIYMMGNPAVYYPNEDGWSIATRDGSLSAVFEQTVLVTADGPKAVTPSHPD